MTGFDIFESAIIRLGLINSKGSIEQQLPFRKSALSVINELAYELCNAEPVNSLQEPLGVDKDAAVVISYGVAFMLATIMNETDKQATMLAIFNAKRKLYLSSIKKIADNMPNVSGG